MLKIKAKKIIKIQTVEDLLRNKRLAFLAIWHPNSGVDWIRKHVDRNIGIMIARDYMTLETQKIILDEDSMLLTEDSTEDSTENSLMVATLDINNRITKNIHLVLLGNSKMQFQRITLETPRCQLRTAAYGNIYSICGNMLLCFDKKKHVDFIKKIRDFENHFDININSLLKVDLQAKMTIPIYGDFPIQKDDKTCLFSELKPLNDLFADSPDIVVILENPVLQTSQTTVELIWKIKCVKLYSK